MVSAVRNGLHLETKCFKAACTTAVQVLVEQPWCPPTCRPWPSALYWFSPSIISTCVYLQAAAAAAANVVRWHAALFHSCHGKLLMFPPHRR